MGLISRVSSRTYRKKNMGKTRKKGDKVEKGGALSSVLQNEMVAKSKNKVQKAVGNSSVSMVDEKLTRRIIKTVQSQAKQEIGEIEDNNDSGMKPMTWSDLTGQQNVIPGTLPSQLGEGDNDGNDLTSKDDIKPIVNEDDEKALEMFFTSDKAKGGIDLNAMIKERLGLVNEAIPDNDEMGGG